MAQKIIVRAARRRGIPVIVATQMLESMTSSPSPTRAEASDVAGGVYEGADALMLSAESAVGAYPLEAISIMDRIIRRVEADPSWPALMKAEHGLEDDDDVDALIAAATRAAEARSTEALVAYTTTGATAQRLGRASGPIHPILAIAPDVSTARRMALVVGSGASRRASTARHRRAHRRSRPHGRRPRPRRAGRTTADHRGAAARRAGRRQSAADCPRGEVARGEVADGRLSVSAR